jgi:hypothetical protein
MGSRGFVGVCEWAADGKVQDEEKKITTELSRRGRFKYASDGAFAGSAAGWPGTAKQSGRCDDSPMRPSDSSCARPRWGQWATDKQELQKVLVYIGWGMFMGAQSGLAETHKAAPDCLVRGGKFPTSLLRSVGWGRIQPL